LPFPHASVIRPGLDSSPGKGTAGLESEAELEEEGEVGDEEGVVVGGEYVDVVLEEEIIDLGRGLYWLHINYSKLS
jgi:hypothetical protein